MHHIIEHQLSSAFQCILILLVHQSSFEKLHRSFEKAFDFNKSQVLRKINEKEKKQDRKNHTTPESQ